MKIDWARKLTSRKLWMAIASEVGMIMIFCGSPDDTVKQVTAMIIGGASIIAYILAEGFTDGQATNIHLDTETLKAITAEEEDEES